MGGGPTVSLLWCVCILRLKAEPDILIWHLSDERDLAVSDDLGWPSGPGLTIRGSSPALLRARGFIRL